MNKFVVVDVETANADLSSICQIGIVVFENGEIIDQFVSLVNPETYFDFFNVSIHGIDESDVVDAPTIKMLEPKIRQYLSNGVVSSYGSFDRTALARSIGFVPEYWLDIMKVVRRTWDDCAYLGYGLANICYRLGINLEGHHDALVDAKAAGQVLLQAMTVSGSDLSQIIHRANQTISLSYEKSRQKSKGNPDGEFYGEALVFTGTLAIPRAEATALATAKGFDVSPAVNSKTNYLVKGLADPSKFNGKEMSSKEIKALDLIKKGQTITFLSESDFFELIK